MPPTRDDRPFASTAIDNMPTMSDALLADIGDAMDEIAKLYGRPTDIHTTFYARLARLNERDLGRLRNRLQAVVEEIC